MLLQSTSFNLLHFRGWSAQYEPVCQTNDLSYSSTHFVFCFVDTYISVWELADAATAKLEKTNLFRIWQNSMSVKTTKNLRNFNLTLYLEDRYVPKIEGQKIFVLFWAEKLPFLTFNRIYLGQFLVKFPFVLYPMPNLLTTFLVKKLSIRCHHLR